MVLKSGIWYTVSSFLSRGILFLATPLFTRLLTQEEFGSFGNFSSWLSLAVIVVTLNVEASLISARYEFEETLDEYLFSALTLSTVSAITWTVLFTVFRDPICRFLQLPPFYVYAILAYALFFPAIQLFQIKERFFFRYKAAAALSLVTSVGSCLLSVILVIVLSDKLGGRVLGQVLPVTLTGAVLYGITAVRGRRIRLRFWRYTARVCLPYVPHLLSMTVLHSTDRIMITKLCGDRDTALYSVAYSVAMIVTLFTTALNSAFSPWLGEKLKAKAYTDIRRVSDTYVTAFSIFAAGLMLIAPELLWLMGGDAYVAARPALLPVFLGCVCQFMYTLFVNVEQFCKKTGGMALASLSAAVLNYLLNAWLIPRVGYLAAAYTTLVGYLWLLAVHMWLVHRADLPNVYDNRRFIALLAILGVTATVIAWLYTHLTWRYIALAVYLTAVIVAIVRKRSHQT